MNLTARAEAELRRSVARDALQYAAWLRENWFELSPERREAGMAIVRMQAHVLAKWDSDLEVVL